MDTTLRSLLTGTRPGRLQSCGSMQIIPLVLSMPADERFAPPRLKVHSPNYGTIDLTNNQDRPTILPAHATYMKKDQGQDHATAQPGLVSARSSSTYQNAMCVQASRGGRITLDEEHPLEILPWNLRSEAIKVRRVQSYSKLWDQISEYNRRSGVQADGHLEYYMDRYKESLEKFVAQFEIVENQVGALIFINGILYGIERTPNPEYWEVVWGPLIRTCYGSVAIAATRMGEAAPPTAMREPMRMDTVSTLDQLADEFARCRQVELDKVTRLVNAMLPESLKTEEDESKTVSDAAGNKHKLKTMKVESDDYIGQAVTDGRGIPYASVLSKDVTGLKQRWSQANEFSM